MQGTDDFISSVAAARALPGGGSVGALAGALAAAIGEKMAGLTEGRELFAHVQPQVLEIHAILTGFRNTLRNLIEEDSKAYQLLLDARRLPRGTEQQKTARAEALLTHARSATETPLQTARAAFKVLECLETLIEIGNPHARSDVAVGAQLAYAALKSGQYNVLANIGLLRDPSFAGTCRDEISDLILKGGAILERIDRHITNC
jgi:methenyltetrahydrofolate cyclohydrolase